MRRFSATVWMLVSVSVGMLLLGAVTQSGATPVPLAQQTPVQQRLEGTINDSLGRPVAGAEVLLQAADGHIVARATTGKDGKFKLRAAPGNFELTVTCRDFKPAAMPLVVVAGNAPAPVTLAMISSKPLTLAVLAPRFASALNDLSPEFLGIGGLNPPYDCAIH